MVLAPGAVNTGLGSQDSTRFGSRANDDNNWTYDGVDNTAIKDLTYGSNVRLLVSMDSIGEFKVSSSLYAAESGGGMGGQVHLVSKSGSNDFHRGAFEYLRNDVFDARSPFDGPEWPQNWVIQLQRTFSPTIVNEAKLGVNRVPRTEHNFGAFASDSYGIPGLTALPSD